MIQAIDITAEQRDTVRSLLARHLPNTEAWVYGSRVRWTSRPESDLDIAVFATPDQARDVSDLREAFEDSNLPFRVDLFVWDEVPESFRREIERVHVVLVERPSGMATDDWLYVPSLPAHWRRRPLYSMAQWVNGLAFRDIQFSSTGRPVIKIAEIKGGISGQTKFTNQTFDDSVRVRPGDLLFAWSGQPESSINAFWWRGTEGWLNQHVFRVTPCPDIDMTFLFYLLLYLRPNFVAIAHNKQTTGLGHVTKQDLQRIRAAAPSPDEQRAIADILGTLDDKIELNRRMNETLEAIARALFKSWFVDFEPVRANMEECETALPLGISSLFPAQLAQVDPQRIPVGWRTYSLDELAEHHTATVSPVATPDATFLHYSIPAYDAGQTPTLEFGAEIKSNKTLVPHGAVLLSKLNPDIPRVWLPSQSLDVPRICSTEFLAFTPLAPASRSLLFSLFCDHAFRTMLCSLVTGTSKSHQRVPPRALKSQFVMAGAPGVFRAFEKLATPWLDRTVANRTESEMLARTRDALLPGLISGEIRVQQAEQILGKVL